MRSKSIARAAALGLILALVSCGGGGGSSTTQPPAPPSPPPPSPPPPTDTTPPDTTLSGGPESLTNQRDASFTFASTEENSTFEASLDGAEYVVVTSPYTVGNLADGEHTLNVRARDAAANVDASPATSYGNVTAIAVDAPAGGAKRYLVASDNGRITAVDAANGDRTLLWPPNAGTDFTAYDLQVDSSARRAYVISAFGMVRALDLANNEMSLLTGLDWTLPQTVRGTGPTIHGTNPRIRANPAAGVAYAVTNDDSIMAIDMTNGQRAIVSR